MGLIESRSSPVLLVESPCVVCLHRPPPASATSRGTTVGVGSQSWVGDVQDSASSIRAVGSPHRRDVKKSSPPPQGLCPQQRDEELRVANALIGLHVFLQGQDGFPTQRGVIQEATIACRSSKKMARRRQPGDVVGLHDPDVVRSNPCSPSSGWFTPGARLAGAGQAA
jgi:hypothetical protein